MATKLGRVYIALLEHPEGTSFLAVRDSLHLAQDTAEFAQEAERSKDRMSNAIVISSPVNAPVFDKTQITNGYTLYEKNFNGEWVLITGFENNT